MNLDLSEQLQNYRKQINSKFKSKQIMAQTILKLAASQTKRNENINTLKQDLTKYRTKQRTSISNFQGSPSRVMMKNNQSPEPMKCDSNSALKYVSPLRSMSQFKQQSPKQSQFQIPTPRDYKQNQSAVKLYTAKYQKILPNEQGHYYSQLQAKLDSLAQLIGSEEDYHENVREVENVIDQNILNHQVQYKQTNVENLKSQQKLLQQDLKQLTFKISRFNAYQD